MISFGVIVLWQHKYNLRLKKILKFELRVKRNHSKLMCHYSIISDYISLPYKIKGKNDKLNFKSPLKRQGYCTPHIPA